MNVVKISVTDSMDIFNDSKNYFAVNRMGRERRRRDRAENAFWFESFQWAANWNSFGLGLHGGSFHFISK